MYPFLKIVFRLEVDRSGYRPPKGPFIVVSNHQSFMDFLLVMLTFYPCRLNAVAAQKFFYYKPLNWLLPIMGAIPKCLFDPDPRSIVGIMSVIKRGGRLLLFPEGRCSTEGVYAGMHKATGKLISKLKVPVASCLIEGAYNCMPFWRKGFRRGHIRVTLADLFSAEDVYVLTVDEINGRIDRRLSGADRTAQINAPEQSEQPITLEQHKRYITPEQPEQPNTTEQHERYITPEQPEQPIMPLRVFKAKKLAEGLQNILFWCPCCGQEFALATGAILYAVKTAVLRQRWVATAF